MVKLSIVKVPGAPTLATPLAYLQSLPNESPTCLTFLTALVKPSYGEAATISPVQSTQFSVVFVAGFPA